MEMVFRLPASNVCDIIKYRILHSCGICWVQVSGNLIARFSVALSAEPTPQLRTSLLRRTISMYYTKIHTRGYRPPTAGSSAL